MADLSSKTEEYEVLEQIGRGTCGATFLVLHKTEQQMYVMKKIRLAKPTEKCKRMAYQEMDVLSKLSNPYILGYKDSWVEKDCCVCIITEYCEGGDMAELVKKSEGILFPEEKLCKWVAQLLLAIDYLHSKRITHRDLKCSNIFLTAGNDIRIGEFGLAKLLSPDALASSVAGTPNDICPELMDNMPYGYKSDIWSLGCCIFEIAAHQPAFKAPNRASLINKVNRTVLSPFPIMYSPTLKQIIKSMLRKHPEHRPSPAELLRHPYLQPYVVRCRDASPVYLPVRSPNSKTKTPSKGSPVKQGSPAKPARDIRSKESRALKMTDSGVRCNKVLTSSNLHSYDKSSTSATSDENLETKRVDPISYSRDTGESPKCDPSNCDLISCNPLRKEPGIGSLQQWLEVNIENGHENVPVELDDHGVRGENGDHNGEVLLGGNIKVPICSEGPNQCLSQPLPPSSPSKERRDEEHEELIKKFSHSPENSGECEEHVVNPSSSSVETAQVVADENAASEREREISLLRTISNALGTTADESKVGVEVPSHQRADALESLLELCARLLKDDKLHELSGVLRPFGEETVSSRETAIWLTKSLMAAQKSAKGSS